MKRLYNLIQNGSFKLVRLHSIAGIHRHNSLQTRFICWVDQNPRQVTGPVEFVVSISGCSCETARQAACVGGVH